MLGKNLVSRVERLDCLTKLDVLDLHCNQLHSIEGLAHLSEFSLLARRDGEWHAFRSATGGSSLGGVPVARRPADPLPDALRQDGGDAAADHVPAPLRTGEEEEVNVTRCAAPDITASPHGGCGTCSEPRRRVYVSQA